MGLPLLALSLAVFGGPVGWYVGFVLCMHASPSEE
jgi:hypothetical protein